MYRILLIFLLLLATLGGCTRSERKPSSSSPSPSSSASPLSSPATRVFGNVSEVLSVTQRNDRAPNFSWKDSTGTVVTFDEFRGALTLVNFWATWCGPCKREMPDLVAISREMADRDVRVIGISVDRVHNAIDLVRSFTKNTGIPFQIVLANEALEMAFGSPSAIPTTYVVNREGRIVQTIVGMRSKRFFTDVIAGYLP